MAYVGINFRATAAYVTDAAGYTYTQTAAGVDTYPTTRGGLTFGYVGSTTGLTTRDRSASNDPRVAGCHYVPSGSPGVSMTFQVDLPAGAGTYNVRVLMGDNASGWTHALDIKDGATTLASISSLTTATARWVDIDGTNTLTNANVAADAYGFEELTFAGSSATFVFGGLTGNNSFMACVEFEEVGGGGGSSNGAAAYYFAQL